MQEQRKNPPRDYSLPIWIWTDLCLQQEQGGIPAEEPGDMTPRFIVFDTETTGLGPKDQVIQLGYLVYNSHGVVLQTYEKLWRCDHRKSNPGAVQCHGITDKEVRTHGVCPKQELAAFRNLLRLPGLRAVAHNAAFDTRLLMQTAQHHGLADDLFPREVMCTMKKLKLMSTKERGPNCKNSDVYGHLGGKPMRWHRALSDATATGFILFTLGPKKGWL